MPTPHDPGRLRVALDRLDSEGPARQPVPTEALPGSEEKLRELERRVRNREELFSPADKRDDPLYRLEVETTLNFQRRATGRVVPVEDGEKSKKMGCHMTVGIRREGFPARLRRLRREAGLTQPALCDASGVSQPHLCRIERGLREPGLSVLIALADALRLTLDELVGRRPPDPKPPNVGRMLPTHKADAP